MVKPAKPKRAAGKPSTAAHARLNDGRIVTAALRIADREGLEAISMRRIADALGAGAMSLYRHVRGKEAILDLLLDAAYGEISIPAAPSGDWRTDLRELARQTRAVLKRHWWLGPLLTARPTLGINYLRWFEFQLAATGAAGLDLPTRTRVIGTVFAYVTGVVGYELGDDAASRRHKLSPQKKRAAAAPLLDPILATGQFPNLAEFVKLSTGEATDADFEFGLECVLIGLAAHVTQSPKGKRSR